MRQLFLLLLTLAMGCAVAEADKAPNSQRRPVTTTTMPPQHCEPEPGIYECMNVIHCPGTGPGECQHLPTTEGDRDCDGVIDNPYYEPTYPMDNCLQVCNPDQANADGDTYGDACDHCPLSVVGDIDSDGRCENEDNCPAHHNPGQEDADSDGFGDPCDQSP